MTVYEYTPKFDTQLHSAVKSSANLAATTKRQYLISLDRFFELIGDPDFLRWEKPQVKAVWDTLCIGDTNHPPIDPFSANKVIFAVRSAIELWADALGLRGLKARGIDRAELLDVTKIDMPEEKLRKGLDSHAPSERDVQALLTYMRDAESPIPPATLRDIVIIVVGLETGMRRSNLAALEWDKIQSSRFSKDVTVIEVRLKSIGDDLIPLSPTALQALNVWKRWCKKQNVTSGPIFRRIVANDDKTFALSPTALVDQSIYDIITKWTSKAGTPHLKPHGMRHALVSWRTNANVAHQAITAITRHALPGMSPMMRVYVDETQAIRACFAATPQWLKDFVDTL